MREPEIRHADSSAMAFVVFIVLLLVLIVYEYREMAVISIPFTSQTTLGRATRPFAVAARKGRAILPNSEMMA